MCSALSVHPSGYYQWVKEPLSQRDKEDKRLLSAIKQFWLESGCYYGYRNIHLDLIEAKYDCGRDRVLRLMQSAGIKANRGYNKPKGMYGGTVHHLAENRLNREFEVQQPNYWWASDITYIKTQEGFLFLAVVMDLFSRKIIGWSMNHLMTEDLTLAAITMAYSRRKPQNTVNLHSDQGSQYTSRNSQKLLETLNIEASMSRRGNCWDNAVAESFFSNLKKEKIQRRVFKSLAEAKQEVFHYIEMFYNPKRRHTYHDRISPVEFEKQYFENQKSG